MKNLSKLLFLIFLLVLILSANLSASGEPYNYREVWNSWTDYQRYVYLWGFKDSLQAIQFDVANIITEFREGKTLSLYELKKVIELANNIAINKWKANITNSNEININFNLVKPDIKVIRDIITDLYKDPANAYISFKNMIFIAIDKLSGEHIESKLEDERKSIKESEEELQELLTK